MAKTKPVASAYERDFHAWTADQAAALRRAGAARPDLGLDFENLAEEIESLGRSDRRALTSHVARIIEHLLKLEYGSPRQPRAGWQRSVDLHRIEAQKLLADSPSLHAHLAATLERSYRDGRRLAARGLRRDPNKGDLPARCPYTLEQILDEEWWPGR